jgi:hypothetical protein
MSNFYFRMKPVRPAYTRQIAPVLVVTRNTNLLPNHLFVYYFAVAALTLRQSPPGLSPTPTQIEHRVLRAAMSQMR